MNTFTMKSEVRFSAVDSALNLTVIALSEMIQDATTGYLTKHEISNDLINPKYHRILVVIRNRMTCFSGLKLGDRVVAEVTLVKKSLAFFVLKTVIYREDTHEACARSYVQLCSIDMDTRKLLPLNDIREYAPLTPDDPEKVDFFPRWNYPNGNEYDVKDQIVASTDIDYSNHLNNIAYFRYLLNCFPSDLLTYVNFREIEINYIKEAIEGSTISVYYMIEGTDIYFLVKCGEDVLTKAKIAFTKD